MSSPERHRVRAIIVTYNPDASHLQQVVAALSPQVESILIVDNASRNSDEIDALSRLEEVDLLNFSANRGIAAALNVGVRHHLISEPDWILTMDQDTLVHPGAIEDILASFDALEAPHQDQVGILAMRAHPQPSSIRITRYADRLLVLKDFESFEERRAVITSGNLVRADVLRRTNYDEDLFIDQVDFDFCFAVRELGYCVLRHKTTAMDHVLGERFSDTDKEHPYESAQRVYYIIRNSTYLVVRRRLTLRFYVAQVIVFSGAFVSMNGVKSLALCARVVLRGMFDGVTGRLGRREYPFLSRGRR
ncbi:MAG TPA: glycosyltransferase [Acidimicrobiales bacterium]